MSPTQDPAQLKARLQELVKNSAALKSLPEDVREERIKLMLSADPKTMAQFIQVLETEAEQMKKVDESFEKDAAEIDNLMAEAKEVEQEAKRELRKEEESDEMVESEKKADELLKKLDSTAGEE